MAATVRHKEIIRGKILYYLGLIYPQAATFRFFRANWTSLATPCPWRN